VYRFLSLNDGGRFDLQEHLLGAREYIPAGFVPIALDSGGNMLLIRAAGASLGRVFFWDHEAARDDPRNLYEVAGSVDEVIGRLLPS
jgi:hypothetical protein